MSTQQLSDSVTRPESIRVKPMAAAHIIGCGYGTVLGLIHDGAFTVFDNGKRGIARRIELLREEVKFYAEHGEDALREFRAKKKRAKR